MKGKNDGLGPEDIDDVIEGASLSQQDRQTTRLIQHLHAGTQAYTRENERSLNLIWNRMVQSREYTQAAHVHWQPDEIQAAREERKIMQEQTVFGGTQPPIPVKKRNVIVRIIGIGLVAALAIMTIVSFTMFSTVFRSGAQVHIKPSTNTGSAGAVRQQQQRTFTPTLVCHAGDIINDPTGWDAELDWSSQGQIVAAGLLNFQIASAQNCRTTSSKNGKSFTYKWSPDGKKLLMIDDDHQVFNVLDSHGNTLVAFSFAQMGISGVESSVWSSDSTSLIFAGPTQKQSVVKSVNIVTHNVRTLGVLPTNSVGEFSPNGKLLLLYAADKSTPASKEGSILWDINSGKQIHLLPSSKSGQNFLTTAFSPDSSRVMLFGSSQVFIYATATGKLQSSFANTNPVQHNAGIVVAWSPDGKYLAEGTNEIRIYAVQTHQMVASFGRLDAQHLIATLVWSPDGTGLISATGPSDFSVNIPIAVNVWRLG